MNHTLTPIPSSRRKQAFEVNRSASEQEREFARSQGWGNSSDEPRSSGCERHAPRTGNGGRHAPNKHPRSQRAPAKPKGWSHDDYLVSLKGQRVVIETVDGAILNNLTLLEVDKYALLISSKGEPASVMFKHVLALITPEG